MKPTNLVISFLATLIVGCGILPHNKTAKETKADNQATVIDTTPRVTGIGGVFFMADDPKKTNEWYRDNFGLEIDQYGAVFEFRNANRPEEVNYLSWAIFRKNNKYFSPSKKEFMINYRVQNIEGLVRNFRNSGITILDTIETYDYGKFVHILDPEGNKIELWEPVDSALKEIDRKTMK